jgi:hypothetical protein
MILFSNCNPSSDNSVDEYYDTYIISYDANEIAKLLDNEYYAKPERQHFFDKQFIKEYVSFAVSNDYDREDFIDFIIRYKIPLMKRKFTSKININNISEKIQNFSSFDKFSEDILKDIDIIEKELNSEK